MERLTLFDVAGPATDGRCILAQSHQCWDAVLHLDGNREDAYLRKNRGNQRDQESTLVCASGSKMEGTIIEEEGQGESKVAR